MKVHKIKNQNNKKLKRKNISKQLSFSKPYMDFRDICPKNF